MHTQYTFTNLHTMGNTSKGTNEKGLKGETYQIFASVREGCQQFKEQHLGLMAKVGNRVEGW